MEAIKNMIPPFFAAGHVNYARWELSYLPSMEAFSGDVHSPHFKKWEHAIQLSTTPWLVLWLDMGIEVSYNQIGKRVAGIIGNRQIRKL